MLRPHPKNPRVHPESAVERLVRSIERFGWTNPILVSADGYIIAGEGRWMAAQRANLEKVPVIDLALSGDDALAYMVADNRLADLTDWDPAGLSDLFSTLPIDTQAFTGFTEEEMTDLLKDYEARAAQAFLPDTGVDQAGSTPTGGMPGAAPDAGANVAYIAYQVTLAQRKIITSAIERARQHFDTSDPGAALQGICEFLLKSLGQSQ